MSADNNHAEGSDDVADISFDRLQDAFEAQHALVSKYRELQKELAKMKRRGQETSTSVSNPFVVVLIDGESYIFRDDLVKAKALGGKKAADQLHKAVSNILERRNLGFCEVVVRVYADVNKLSKQLFKTELVGAEKRSLSTFISGFNDEHVLFDFTDSGESPHATAKKVNAVFEHFVNNDQCVRIFFAGSHEAACLANVDPSTASQSKITLIRRPNTSKEESISNTYNVEELPELFTTRSIDDTVTSNRVGAVSQSKPPTPKPVAEEPKAQTNALPAKPDVTVVPSQKTCAFFKAGKCKFGALCRNSHAEESAAPSLAGSAKIRNKQSPPVNVFTDETATEGPVLSTMQIFTDLPRLGSIPATAVPINASQHRLDPLLLATRKSGREELKARFAAHRLCADHHIVGGCSHGKECVYDHSDISPEIRTCYLANILKTPCEYGGACRKLNCYRGHHCQSVDCTFRGGKFTCKYPEEAHLKDHVVAAYKPGSRETPEPEPKPQQPADNDDDDDHDLINLESDREWEDSRDQAAVAEKEDDDAASRPESEDDLL